MRRKVLAAIIGVAVGSIAWPCAGPVETATWSVAKVDFDPYGSGPILLPANDTRANLLLLIADRQGLSPVAAGAKAGAVPLVLMPWKVMRGQAVPDEDEYGSTEGSRCDSASDGEEAFLAALSRSRAAGDDKTILAEARKALDPRCNSEMAVPPLTLVRSRPGQAFAVYLDGAAKFYAGQFEQARRAFGSEAVTADPWVRETSSYMVGRTLLNAAIEKSLNKWGDIAPENERDRAGAIAAGEAFTRYLKAFPDGLYAASARGLMRRVEWLSGNANALAANYGRARLAVRSPAAAADLADEIDNKLFESGNRKTLPDPVLTAVRDLQRMRSSGPYGQEPEEPVISRAEIEAQAAIFANDRPLLDYLRAAHALFVAKSPAEVLTLVPESAPRTHYTYLELSRQVLRGIALESTGGDGTRAYWLDLLPGAVQPYQRDAVALAVARHDEAAGRPERVFAEGSPVTHPVMRDLLLEFSAGPELLRSQARNGITDHEKRVAAYILLAKELQRGFYADFVRDYPLLPKGGTDLEGWYWGAQYYTPAFDDSLGDPPLEALSARADEATGCPDVVRVARALAADPSAVRPRLCLAEFFRKRGFDNFSFDQPIEGGGLGSGPSQFPGKPYVRMAAYQAVLADKRASADDRAFALNRMVRCYAPSGISSCGGEDVPVATRKAWFDRLKRDYPASRWAKDLRYYW